MRVDLQEGFKDDLVEMYVNGEKVVEREGVTTKPVLGFALSREFDAPEGPIEIEIRVPTQNLSQVFSVDSSETPHLGVSIQNGELTCITSRKRFGYA